jgi:hypothetical protein
MPSTNITLRGAFATLLFAALAGTAFVGCAADSASPPDDESDLSDADDALVSDADLEPADEAPSSDDGTPDDGDDTAFLPDSEDAVPAVAGDPDRPGFVHTPRGPIHASCVHTLEDGDRVDQGGVVHSVDGSVHSYPPCGFDPGGVESLDRVDPAHDPTINGWIEAGQWTSKVGVRSLKAVFRVPKAPKRWKNGKVVFLFPSLEHTGAHPMSIVQPVLDYGDWGKPHWSIASWFGGSEFQGHYFHTKPRRVSVGEDVVGRVHRTGTCNPHGCDYVISVHDTNNTKNLNITVNVDHTWYWAQAGVLEAYKVTSCRNLPASATAFRQLSLVGENGKKLNPNWSGMFWTREYRCGYGVGAPSDQKVVLRY